MEFEKRLLTAQMLEQNLVAEESAVSPSPAPETQSRYEQVRRELLDQLQASANIFESFTEDFCCAVHAEFGLPED